MKKLLNFVARIFMKTNIIEQMMIVAVSFMFLDISLFDAIVIGIILFIIMDALDRYKKRKESK